MKRLAKLRQYQFVARKRLMLFLVTGLTAFTMSGCGGGSSGDSGSAGAAGPTLSASVAGVVTLDWK